MIDCQLYIVVVAHRMFLPFFRPTTKLPVFLLRSFSYWFIINFLVFLDAGPSIVPAGIETYSGRPIPRGQRHPSIVPAGIETIN